MDYNNNPDLSGQPSPGEPPTLQSPSYPANPPEGAFQQGTAPQSQPYQPPVPPPPPPPAANTYYQPQQPNQQFYQPYPQQQNYQPQPPPPPSDGKRGMAIASMVTGIVSIVMSLIVSCALFLGLPCSVIAVILGCVSLKSSGRGMAIAGIVCGAIGALILVMWLILMVIGIAVSESYYGYY